MKKLTWDEFDYVVKELSQRILFKLELSGLEKVECRIYGQPRGGLCLATAISHRTGINLCTDFYRNDVKTIWIDDIIDSGETLQEAFSYFKNDAIYVSWFVRGCRPVPAVIFHEIENSEQWLVFPWEDTSKAEEDHASYTKRKNDSL